MTLVQTYTMTHTSRGLLRFNILLLFGAVLRTRELALAAWLTVDLLVPTRNLWQRHLYKQSALSKYCSVLFLSRPWSDGWPHHGRTFSIYLYPLSFWLTLPQRVLSTTWCCLSRLCVVYLACVHLALFLALFLSPGNSLVMAPLHSRCGHYILQLCLLSYSFFYLFSSPILSDWRLDVYHCL